jgi:RNA polymerase sigma factor (sigma-70 family)
LKHHANLTISGDTDNIEEAPEAFDQRILSGLLIADEQAWTEFYDHYKERLDSFFEEKGVYLENDRADLFQETMRAVFRSLPNYNPERGSLRRWVYGVATNVMRSAQREFSTLYSVEENDEVALTRAAFVAPDTLSDDIEQANDPDLVMVKRGLASLSDRDQEILIMRVTREATWAELAQELREGESAVKMRYKRALDKLKDALHQDSFN